MQLVPARTRIDFSGRWLLTISASACQTTRFGPLPEEAKTRRYSAAVTQDGPHLRLTLADAEFVIVGGRGNMFAGTTDPNDSMRLTIAGPSDYYYYYYRTSDLVERLTDGTQLPHQRHRHSDGRFATGGRHACGIVSTQIQHGSDRRGLQRGESPLRDGEAVVRQLGAARDASPDRERPCLVAGGRPLCRGLVSQLSRDRTRS